MASVYIAGDRLRVRLTRAEKVLGLLRDTDVPLSQVRDVEVVADGLAAPSGMRAPGYSWPWSRKIGTWRRPGRTSMVSVRRAQPAVRIRLEGHRYDELVLGADDAETLAASLAASLRTPTRGDHTR
jgi:hypothetical protein